MSGTPSTESEGQVATGRAGHRGVLLVPHPTGQRPM
jgi:hypothetical protein